MYGAGKQLSIQSLTIDLWLVPGVIVGLVVGIRFVKRINEVFFRRFILVMTAIGAILIYFK